MDREHKGRKTRAEVIATAENRYVRLRTIIGVLLLACIVLVSLGILVAARVRLTNAQLYATNRVRIQTVLNGLESGGTERAGLEGEYDQIYIAKMKNTQHYYHGFAPPHRRRRFCARGRQIRRCGRGRRDRRRGPYAGAVPLPL